MNIKKKAVQGTGEIGWRRLCEIRDVDTGASHYSTR